MAEEMNKIVDPYGVLVGMKVTEETMKKWRKESELFAKYGSEMLHKYGFEGLEKKDNEPKYIEEPEPEEESWFPTSKTTNITYLVKFFKAKKNRTRVGG